MVIIEALGILAPALSALVGGLVVVLGGSLRERRASLNKNREFVREKIQEIYSLTIEAEEWGQQETVNINHFIETGTIAELDHWKSKSKQIRMLLSLYFDQSEELCEELTKFETIFFEGMRLAYQNPAEFKGPEKQKLIMDSSVLYFSSLVNIRDYLESEMSRITRLS